MGKGNKQVKAGEQTVINSLPDYARPYFENLMERAEGESLQGYQPYQGQRIAEFTPDQLGAYQGIRSVAGRQMPGLGQARDTAMGLAQGINVPQVTSAYQGREVAPTYQGREVSPVYQGNQFQEERILDRMQDYQNPYTENVLDRFESPSVLPKKPLIPALDPAKPDRKN